MLPSRGEVVLPPLRPGVSAMGLYQDPEADSSSRARAGDADRCLHRRHSPHGRVSGESERPGIRVRTPSTMPGLYDKSRENRPGTNTVLGVPGFHGKHSIDGADTPTKEI